MRVIKKYSNRRLYDSSSSAYVNLESIAGIVQDGELVQVVDARTGEDLTRPVLLQVLQEVPGALETVPVGLLHRMIRFGGAAAGQVMYRKQLAAGLEMLDAQIVRMEQQFNALRPDAPPMEPVLAASAPAAEGRGAEMDALRQRLAALEARMSPPESER